MLISIKKVTKDKKSDEQVVREVTISATDIIGIRKWSKGKQDQGIEGDMCLATVASNGQEKRYLIAEAEAEFKKRLVSIGIKIG